MTAKKTTKKTTAKRVTKPKITLKDSTLYVVLIRTGFFTWSAHAVYETYDEAVAVKRSLEHASALGIKAAKVESVKLSFLDVHAKSDVEA